jgi:hypothetical protein
MLGTFYPMRVIRYINEGTAPVKPSPRAGLGILLVIALTPFMAKGAVIFVPAVGTSMNADVVHPILIRVKIASFNNSTLDIE